MAELLELCWLIWKDISPPVSAVMLLMFTAAMVVRGVFDLIWYIEDRRRMKRLEEGPRRG